MAAEPVLGWLLAGSQLWTSDERAALCALASSEAAIVTHCSSRAETPALQLIPLLASIAPYFHMRGKQRSGVSILSRVVGASGIALRDFAIEDARADFAAALLGSTASAPFPICPPEEVLSVPDETVDINVWRTAAAADAARGGVRGEADAAAAASPAAAARHARVGDLMRACLLDGLGQNTYAATEYAAAWHAFANAHAVAAQHSGVDAAIVCSRALDGAGRVARERGDYALSLELHAAALRAVAGGAAADDTGACRFASPSRAVCCANALSNAGVARYRLRDLDGSAALHARALALRETSGEQRGLASSLGNLALVHATRGGAEGRAAAAPLYARSLKIRRDLEDTWGVAGSLRALADLALVGGDAATASARACEAVKIFAAVGE